jgi:hypothetical protein
MTCGCSCAEEDACLVKMICGLYFFINIFFIAECMTLGLVMLSFMKLVVHQHCLELLCDYIIRHRLLVAQGKGCYLS